ncbi:MULTISPECIES: hypothetical protein [Oceanithermus]|uniref:Uncharacterized protein n=3 Tax=Oceanithermus TaxID=208447 RepID=E4U7T5_OCEP5|nr:MULTISPECIES: hypothetical protein [Oceanithermus]ADR36534.1 hypothetical protein Ocepr_1077 [Oceanithermus profundus DSM 14977]MBB6030344.1 hypothetical protein [Oceanithermus desulfurans]GEM89355.1 hypothetical protein ODE01S_07890 [Oceanithermus desulfurans NBRC 100063]
MAARGDWLEYTRERAPEGVPQDVYDVVRRWLETHEVAEVDLEPMNGYYAIHINGAPEPVPGVFLPKTLEHDPQAVRDLLDAAFAVYEQEIAAH